MPGNDAFTNLLLYHLTQMIKLFSIADYWLEIKNQMGHGQTVGFHVLEIALLISSGLVLIFFSYPGLLSQRPLVYLTNEDVLFSCFALFKSWPNPKLLQSLPIKIYVLAQEFYKNTQMVKWCCVEQNPHWLCGTTAAAGLIFLYFRRFYTLSCTAMASISSSHGNTLGFFYGGLILCIYYPVAWKCLLLLSFLWFITERWNHFLYHRKRFKCKLICCI